jgi:hypothetical protein
MSLFLYLCMDGRPRIKPKDTPTTHRRMDVWPVASTHLCCFRDHHFWEILACSPNTKSSCLFLCCTPALSLLAPIRPALRTIACYLRRVRRLRHMLRTSSRVSLVFESRCNGRSIVDFGRSQGRNAHLTEWFRWVSPLEPIEAGLVEKRSFAHEGACNGMPLESLRV